MTFEMAKRKVETCYCSTPGRFTTIVIDSTEGISTGGPQRKQAMRELFYWTWRWERQVEAKRCSRRSVGGGAG